VGQEMGKKRVLTVESISNFLTKYRNMVALSILPVTIATESGILSFLN
jgi:hypothetical protein